MIQGLLDQQADTIIEIEIGDADADYYKYEPMAALMDWQETIKKYNQSKHFHNQREHFYPFYLSVNRILGKEDLVALAQSSRTMAAKMDKLISHVRGWINSQIEIAVARLYSQMTRRARLPSPLRERELELDPE